VSYPLWRELQSVIVVHDGSLVVWLTRRLFRTFALGGLATAPPRIRRRIAGPHPLP
jgi:hypothetical protein